MKRKGFTLVELAIVLVILGLLIGIGTGTMIQFIKWNKRKETKSFVNKQVEEIIGEISSIGKISSDSLNSSQIKDAYSQNIITIYADKISSYFLSPKNATVCDLKTTKLSYSDNATGTTVNNIAFIVFSKGEDYKSDTYCNGERVTENRSCTGNVTTDSTKDIVNFVTLPQLKSYLGCPGNPLKILNNELPVGQVGGNYSATIYVEGGIKPYKWCYDGTLPPGINVNPSSKCNNNYTESDNFSITGTPSESGSWKIKVCVKDSNEDSGYERCKWFSLTINEPTSSSNGTGGGSSCESYTLEYSSTSIPFWLYPIYLMVEGRCIYESEQDCRYLVLAKKCKYKKENLSPEATIVIGKDRWCSSRRIILQGTVQTLDKNHDCITQITCRNNKCSSE